MHLYVKLADAEGEYEIETKYVHRESGSKLAGAKMKLAIKDRLQTTDFHIPFPPLQIPQQGRYEFQIWANSVFLGTAFLDAGERKL